MLYKDLIENIEDYIKDNKLDRNKLTVAVCIDGDFDFWNGCNAYGCKDIGFTYAIDDDNEICITADLWKE